MTKGAVELVERRQRKFEEKNNIEIMSSRQRCNAIQMVQVNGIQVEGVQNVRVVIFFTIFLRLLKQGVA